MFKEMEGNPYRQNKEEPFGNHTFTGLFLYDPVVEDDLLSGKTAYKIARTLKTSHGDATAGQIKNPANRPRGSIPVSDPPKRDCVMCAGEYLHLF